MIIFINGSFGVGKTTVAELLVQRLPNSLLYDPEEVGYFLSKIVHPIDHFDDFQDLFMWRTLVVTTAKLLKETYRRTLIMPMTIWHRPYFDEVMSGLRSIEPDLLHVCLTASAETLYNRVAQREHTPEARTWIHERIECCVVAFQGPEFAVHIDAEHNTPEEIVQEILVSIQ